MHEEGGAILGGRCCLPVCCWRIPYRQDKQHHICLQCCCMILSGTPPPGGGRSCPRWTQLVAFGRLDLFYRTPASPAFPMASLVWHLSLKWLNTYLSFILLNPHLVQDFNPVVEPTWNQENSPWEVNIGSPKNIIVKVQATTPGIQISSPKSMSIQFQEVGAHKWTVRGARALGCSNGCHPRIQLKLSQGALPADSESKD